MTLVYAYKLIIIRKYNLVFLDVIRRIPGIEEIEILPTNNASPKVSLAPLYDQLLGGYSLGVGDTMMQVIFI